MARGYAQGAQNKCSDGQRITRTDTPSSAKGTAFCDERWGEVIDCGAAPQEPLTRDAEDPQVASIPIVRPQLVAVAHRHGDSTTIFTPVAGVEHACNPVEFGRHFVPSSHIGDPTVRPEDAGDLSKAPSDDIQSPAFQRSDAVVRPNKRRSLQNSTLKPSRAGRGRPACLTSSAPAVDVTYSFHVGNQAAVEDFLARRFKELTLKPIRSLVREWMKLAEPDRKQNYGSGKYTYKSPAEDSSNTSYPLWWPKDSPYQEAAHLRKEYLVPVAIQILLLHRYPDADGKRRVNWIYKLRSKTDHWMQGADSCEFAASDDAEYRGFMKRRATQEIIPDILDVAQSYEDYLAMLNEKKGSNANTTLGKLHTWSPACKPPRPPPRPKKRRRCDKDQSDSSQEDECALSCSQRQRKGPSPAVTRENTPGNDPYIAHFRRASHSPVPLIPPAAVNPQGPSPPRAITTIVPPPTFVPEPVPHPILPSSGFCTNCTCSHCCAPGTYHQVHGLSTVRPPFFPAYPAGQAHMHADIMDTPGQNYSVFAAPMEEKPQWSSFSSSDTVLDDTQGPVDFVGYNPLDIGALPRYDHMMPLFPVPHQQPSQRSPMRF